MGTVVYATVNGRVLSQTRSGVRSLYSLDPLGNTRALYDNTGAKTDTFTYTPFGTVTRPTGTTSTPFQWNGGSGYYQNSATRVYVRARNYYANLGKWSTQDPIGFAGDDFNLYRYVKNGVVTAKDPSGLDGEAHKISDAIVTACKHITSPETTPVPKPFTGEWQCVEACLLPLIELALKNKRFNSPPWIFTKFLLTVDRYNCLQKWCEGTTKQNIRDAKARYVTPDDPKFNQCPDANAFTYDFGSSQPGSCVIGICPKFFDVKRTPDDMARTIIHEAIHCCGGQFETQGAEPVHAAFKVAAACIFNCKAS